MKQTISKRKTNNSRRVQTKTVGDTLTEQSHKEQCDINKIMAKARAMDLPLPFEQGLTYGDFTDPVDYHRVHNQIAGAKTDFYRLPAETRARFKNDPSRLLEFLQNPANLQEAVELGLCNPRDLIQEKTPENQPEAPVEPSAEPVQ